MSIIARYAIWGDFIVFLGFLQRNLISFLRLIYVLTLEPIV